MTGALTYYGDNPRFTKCEEKEIPCDEKEINEMLFFLLVFFFVVTVL